MGPLEKWMTLDWSSVFATKNEACRHRGPRHGYPNPSPDERRHLHMRDASVKATRQLLDTTREMDDS